jgi:hypothetical protein
MSASDDNAEAQGERMINLSDNVRVTADAMQFILQHKIHSKEGAEGKWKPVAYYRTINQLAASVAHSAVYEAVKDCDNVNRIYVTIQAFIDRAELSLTDKALERLKNMETAE